MRKMNSFFMTTFLGGMTVILPVAILVFVFQWLFNLVRGLISPVTSVIESNLNLPGLVADIIAIAIILLICFFVGIMIKTNIGRWLHITIEERILKVAPGYNLIKETVLQILGNKKSPFSTVALAQIFGNETMVTSFVTDEYDDGSKTVFVPTGPNPTSGNIYHLKGEFVHPVDVSVEEAMRSIISCGSGSQNLIETYKKKLK